MTARYTVRSGLEDCRSSVWRCRARGVRVAHRGCQDRDKRVRVRCATGITRGDSGRRRPGGGWKCGDITITDREGSHRRAEFDEASSSIGR